MSSSFNQVAKKLVLFKFFQCDVRGGARGGGGLRNANFPGGKFYVKTFENEN